jgi:hypothetical protein
MVAGGRPVTMHDLVHLYADQLPAEHPQADGPEPARDRRSPLPGHDGYRDMTGAAMLRWMARASDNCVARPFSPTQSTLSPLGLGGAKHPWSIQRGRVVDGDWQ